MFIPACHRENQRKTEKDRKQKTGSLRSRWCPVPACSHGRRRLGSRQFWLNSIPTTRLRFFVPVCRLLLADALVQRSVGNGEGETDATTTRHYSPTCEEQSPTPLPELSLPVHSFIFCSCPVAALPYLLPYLLLLFLFLPSLPPRHPHTRPTLRAHTTTFHSLPYHPPILLPQHAFPVDIVPRATLDLAVTACEHTRPSLHRTAICHAFPPTRRRHARRRP